MKSEQDLILDSKKYYVIEPDSVQNLYRPMINIDLPPKPSPDDDDEYNYNFWKEQHRRCRYGWIAPDGKFINPIYYFFLNFIKIDVENPITGKSGPDNPFVRDNDKEIFDLIWYSLYGQINGIKDADGMWKAAVNIIETKGRRIGWTQITLCGLTIWHFVFIRNRNIANAYPDDDTENRERLLIRDTYNALHPYFRSHDEHELELVIDNEKMIVQGYKRVVEVMVNGKIIEQKKNVLLNKIFIATYSKDTGKVRGEKIGLFVVIEAGKHKKLEGIYTSNKDSLGLGKRKFGMMVIGGTSDAIENDTDDYKVMYQNAPAYLAVSHFSPAYMVYDGCFNYNTGKSDKKAALNELMKARRTALLSPKSSAYLKECQERPIKDTECFNPPNTSPYDTDTIDLQVQKIMRDSLHKDNWMTGSLEWEKDFYGKNTGKVYFQPSEKNSLIKGKWQVHVEGMPVDNVDNIHIGATDDYYKAKLKMVTNTSSKGCMTVYRIPCQLNIKSDFFVAVYLDRPKDRLLLWEEWLKASIFWNLKIFHEKNDDMFEKFMTEKGFLEKMVKINGEYGITVKETQVAQMTTLGMKFLSDGRHKNIDNLDIMNSFKKWGSTNSDIASCVHLTFFGLDFEKQMAPEVKEASQSATYIKFGKKSLENNEDSYSILSVLDEPKEKPNKYFKFGKAS